MRRRAPHLSVRILPAKRIGTAILLTATAVTLAGPASAQRNSSRSSSAGPATASVTQEWVATLASSTGDQGDAIVTSPDGSSVFATGGCCSLSGDFATLAYDSATGQQRWSAFYDGPAHGTDAGIAVAVSEDGTMVFVTGTSAGGSSSTDYDYATVAYDAATGAQLWVARYVPPVIGVSEPMAIGVSPDGSRVFVTGQGSSSTTYDYATLAYDASTGTQLWLRTYSGPGNAGDVAYALAISPDGGLVIVTGSSYAGGTNSPMTTVAYDASNGDQRWVANPSVPSGDYTGQSMGTSPDSALVFVSGWGQSSGVLTVAFDSGTGSQHWLSRTTSLIGRTALKVSPDGATVYVAADAVDSLGIGAYAASDGTQEWLNTSNPGGFRGMDLSRDGSSVAVTGFVIDGQFDDYEAAGYDPVTGVLEWSASYNGSGNAEDMPQAVAEAPDGSRVYVTGSTTGTTTGQDFTTVAYGNLGPPPAVLSLSPRAGPVAGGTSVTITGSNFASPATVDFGQAPATNVVVNSDTLITATSPTASMTGTVDVVVTTGDGSSSTSGADLFAYVNSWKNLGPSSYSGQYGARVSGRVTTIASFPPYPQAPTTVFLGSEGGGVWRSASPAGPWKSISQSSPSLAVNAIAVDPTNPQVIYAGSGEVEAYADVPIGPGIVKTMNGGTDWQTLSLPEGRGSPLFVNSLVIDRSDHLHVLAGTDQGVMVSSDGGSTWYSRAYVGNATQITQDPATPSKFWAASSAGKYGTACIGDVWTSTDGGRTWNVVFHPPTYPSGPFDAGVGLGVGINGIAYASFTDCRSGQPGEIDRTTDGGSTWSKIEMPPPPQFPAGAFANVVAVDPTDPCIAVFGSVNLYATVNGCDALGVHYSNISFNIVHDDFHAFAFTSHDALYVGNDGGVWSTTCLGGADPLNPCTGAPWQDLNTNSLGIATFLAGRASDASHLLGGTQDNATPGKFGSGWKAFLSGDGGYSAFSLNTSGKLSVLYATQDLDLWMQIGSSQAPVGPCSLLQHPLFPPACVDQVGGQWYTQFPDPPVLMNPSSSRDLLFATSTVFESPSSGPALYGWNDLDSGGILVGSTPSGFCKGFLSLCPPFISAMAAQWGSSNAQTIYVGSNYGVVYMGTSCSLESGCRWTNITGNLPQATPFTKFDQFPWISAIAFNPNDTSEVWVTIDGYGICPADPACDPSGGSGHVWHTTNAGQGATTWTDVSGAGLGDVPTTGLALDGNNPPNVYIGTSAGALFCTTCSGSATSGAWVPAGIGAPAVWVADLNFTKDCADLVAWSFGRGAWAIIPPVAPRSGCS